jgi:hypothetical protein
MKTFFLLIAFATANTLASELYIGLHSSDLTPKVTEQIPLGGYGDKTRRNWPLDFNQIAPHLRLFKPALGHLDPIRSKVMYLKKNDKKLLFISLDLIGVTKEMHADLIRKLNPMGFNSEDVIISGTHTHSGPGALAKNTFWAAVAMDRFQKKFYNKFLDGIVDSVAKAIKKATEGEIYQLNFETENLQNNRRGNSRPLNKEANLILAKSRDGQWLGGIIHFAVHGTSLDSDNFYFSSDVPGAIEREVENFIDNENGFVRLIDKSHFLFIQGAEGDVSPKLNYQQMGIEFAKQVSSHFNQAVMIESEWKNKELEIDLGKSGVTISKCTDQKWIPKNLSLGVKKWISPASKISQIHIGNLWLLTWPGEPTTELGNLLIEKAKEKGAQTALVLGLTNDHKAYFVSPNEYEAGGYESCMNFFGKNGGIKIINEHKNLMDQIKE